MSDKVYEVIVKFSAIDVTVGEIKYEDKSLFHNFFEAEIHRRREMEKRRNEGFSNVSSKTVGRTVN